jgi:hypothetical protein
MARSHLLKALQPARVTGRRGRHGNSHGGDTREGNTHHGDTHHGTRTRTHG